MVAVLRKQKSAKYNQAVQGGANIYLQVFMFVMNEIFPRACGKGHLHKFGIFVYWLQLKPAKRSAQFLSIYEIFETD